MSFDSSQPPTNSAARLSPSAFEVSKAISRWARASSSMGRDGRCRRPLDRGRYFPLGARFGHFEEGLGARLVLLGLIPGARALLGLLQPRLRIFDAALELAGVELVRRDRLAYEHRRAV